MSRSGEFERIARYFAPLTAGFDGAAGLQDDAAVLTVPNGRELVVTTDTIVEKVHYLGPESPSRIAKKLLRVNLSDLAAKGAVPHWYTLNIAVPGSVEDAWFEGLCKGLREDQERYSVTLAGGDTVRSDGAIVLTLTGFGSVAQGAAIRRAGATPGDLVYVTGTIGDAALGLRCARGAFPDLPMRQREALIERYELPDPPVAFGASLGGIASASVDISDGLAADTGHLAGASGVAVAVHAQAVPVSDATADVLAEDPDLMRTVLSGGDDYQILCTVPPAKEAAFRTLAEDNHVMVTRIGRIDAGEGLHLLDQDDAPLSLSELGYVHS